MNEEHWSSPNGCHPDCPVCAEERTYQEAALRWRSRDLLKVCEETLEAIQTWQKALENRLFWSESFAPHKHEARDRELIEGMSMSKTSLMAAIAKAKGQT